MSGRRRGWRRRVRWLPLAWLSGAVFVAQCAPWSMPAPAQDVPGGEPQRGQLLLNTYGCGACHMIPGVAGATGKVGPPLAGVGERSTIAGTLANTPENLIRWIRHPQAIEPGNVMPDVGVTEPDARHIAAYLYTLR